MVLIYNNSILLGFSNGILKNMKNIEIISYLLIGFNTGMCGCLTSFSSFINAISYSLVKNVF